MLFNIKTEQQKIESAVRCIQAQLRRRDDSFQPEVALTLGSGLQSVAEDIHVILEMQYEQIPYFPHSTVAGHTGKLILGMLYGVPILAYQGRKHYYEVALEREGIRQVVFPVHVAAKLGCSFYFATNAAGGLNPMLHVGDIMPITSHLTIGIPNPLSGPSPEFVPLNNAYDKQLTALLIHSIRKYQKKVHAGVYLAQSGPSYEAIAEVRLFRDVFTADAVGMSTVPEVIVAAAYGMKTVAFSLITNTVRKDGSNSANHAEVLAVLNDPQVKEKVKLILKEFFLSISSRA